MAERALTLGIPTYGFMEWGGGVDFLGMVSDSLRRARPDAQLHAFIPYRGPLVAALRTVRDRALALAGHASPAAHRPPIEHLERVLAESDVVLHRITPGLPALAKACSRLCVDALVPSIEPLPAGFPPWVGYIFDFQHKYLPHFFTEGERELRDASFARMLGSARSVIVNAKEVARDVERFHPGSRARIFSLPFSPAPTRDAFALDVHQALSRFGVATPYFIVCNQFWKHKDHGTAFRAFGALARRHPGLSLVCTGSTSDSRFPDHFRELMQQAERDGAAGRIRVLGRIPKPDQLALLRGAVALIQPTLFEGGPGGGAVYDALAVGQRAIVSDIAVNREIEDERVTFFRASDPEHLALTMEQLLRGMGERAPPGDPDACRLQGLENRAASGRALLQSLREAGCARA